MPKTIAAIKARKAEIADELQNPDLDEEQTRSLCDEADALLTEEAEWNQRTGKREETLERLRKSGAGQRIDPETGKPLGETTRAVTRSDVLDKIFDDKRYRSVVRAGRGSWTMDLDADETRALFGARAVIDSGDAGLQPTPRPGIMPALLQRLRVADLFDRQTTTASELTYVQDQTTDPGNAAEVAEGDKKAQSDYALSVQHTTFAKIAHFLYVTMEALEDQAQFEGLLRGRMLYGLEYRLDGQLMNGNGVGANLKGIRAQTGIGITAPSADQKRIITLRKAKTVVALANVPTDGLAVVISPSDEELIDLSLGDDGHFMSGLSAFAPTPPTIWGMPRVETATMEEGVSVVGAFRSATIWDRMGARLAITDSNKDQFEDNILTMRAELRVGLEVPYPAAFDEVTYHGDE